MHAAMPIYQTLLHFLPFPTFQWGMLGGSGNETTEKFGVLKKTPCAYICPADKGYEGEIGKHPQEIPFFSFGLLAP